MISVTTEAAVSLGVYKSVVGGLFFISGLML